MSEEITKYVVEAEFDSSKATKELAEFNKKLAAYNRSQSSFRKSRDSMQRVVDNTRIHKVLASDIKTPPTSSKLKPVEVKSVDKQPINRLSTLSSKEKQLPNLYKYSEDSLKKQKMYLDKLRDKQVKVTYKDNISNLDRKLQILDRLRVKPETRLLPQSAPPTVVPTSNKPPTQPSTDKVAKERERESQKAARELNRAHVAAIKANIAFDKKAEKDALKRAEIQAKKLSVMEASKRKQAIDSLVKPARPAYSAKGSVLAERETKGVASNKRRERIREQESSGLNKAKEGFRRSSLNLSAATTQQEKIAKDALLEAVAKAKTGNEVRMIVAKERERLRVMRQQERSQAKQTYLMRRMTESSKQFAGNMVSAFAVAGLTSGVTKVGMEMEGIDSALLAVSGSAKLAADDLSFIKEESMRLGKPLKESADAFVKMSAARGNLSRGQVRETFTSIQEAATVLGLNADQVNRANIAISQMMSKGKITAEELKNQLAESGFANAIPEMVKAAQDIGIIDKNMGLVEATARFYKLQEQGKVITEQILPAFSKRMKSFAAGGLEEKLKGTTVALGQLMNSLTLTADIMFKSGFGKGVGDLARELMASVTELKPLWESLGTIIGSVFSLIAKGIKAVTPTLKAFASVLKSISSALGESYAWMLSLTTVATLLFSAVSKVGGSKLFLMKTLPILGQISAMLYALKEAAFWAEELDNLLFSRNKIGVLYDPRTGVNKNNLVDLLTPFTSPEKATKQANIVANADAELNRVPTWFSSFIRNQQQMGIYIPELNTQSKPVNVNIKVNADAAKMGLTMSQDSSVKDAIHTEIKQVMN